MATLATEPRWTGAAQALVDGLVDLREDEERVVLLAAVCEGLGDELYPAFLRVLSIIGRHGDHAACAAVASALVHALRTGRLPSGRRSAWGARGEPAYAAARHLGPLEYLCAWHSQAEPALALPPAAFDSAARALMDLVASSREARLLYCEKLIADAEDPLAATLTRRTRAALRALATAWAQGADSASASACFLAACSASPALGPFPTGEGRNGGR